MSTPKPKQLLVEGVDDQAVVIHLMKHNGVHWPKNKEDAPVYINVENSADEILDARFVGAKLKESGLRVLGLLIDADDKFSGRWQRVRELFMPTFPAIPRDMPPSGLVAENEAGLRLAVWFMPDCASPGMMETFLRFCVPDDPDASALWKHAEAAFEEAKRKKCRCRGAHEEKARIHTWLAWQDPPGERLGLALARKILNPHAPCAAPFITWFRQLYDV